MTLSNSPTASPAWKIALVSASVLLLELTMIRLVPAEVRVISYFTNLMLMAAFFGLGVGAVLNRRLNLAWTLPVGLVGICVLVYVARGLVIYDEAEGVHFWLQYTNPLHAHRHEEPVADRHAGLSVGLGRLTPIRHTQYPRLAIAVRLRFDAHRR